MFRIVIADDHAIVLQGLSALLQQADDIELVGECSNGLDALALIQSEKPDIALLDISMPGMDGITLAARLNGEQPETAVIILTTHKDPVLYEHALKVGVKGYIYKNAAFELLLDSIRLVASGSNLMHPCTDIPPENARFYTITDREREVLGLIANGLTNRMIAETLKISINTVDRHRSNLMLKLGLHTTAELVRYSIKIGII